MDKSIFIEKEKTPTEKDLKKVLSRSYELWHDIYCLVYQKFPAAISEWNFPGKKYGWSFRIKDKKRAIVYLLPRDKYFKVAFVFGYKAFGEILKSSISDEIKTELKAARVFAEGRGIRLEVRHKKALKDITKLIEIKIAN